MAECSALAQGRLTAGSGIGARDVIDGWLLNLLLIIAEERRSARRSADLSRLCDLSRPQDLGGGAAAPRSQCRRTLGPAAELRRHVEIRAEGAGDPGHGEQGRVSARAFRDRVLAVAAWAVIPVADGWAVADLNVGILYIFAISSLGVYGIIMGGWASNSKYPFLSALRSAAQMVSYEVSIGFVIITVLLCAGSLNLTEIVRAQDTQFGVLGWYWLRLLPMFVIFFISALAETNRPPFDLVEAESELVAGFMVEYSATPYMLFMLGEYVAILTMCAMMTILFFGGWLPPVNFAPFTWCRASSGSS